MNKEIDEAKEAVVEDLKKNLAVPFLKRFKSAPSFFIMIATALILVFTIVFTAVKILPTYLKADSLGESIGGKLGDAVGWAIGSFNGITTGKKEGGKAGKEEGLSAKDTSVIVANKIKETGNLEVLVAGIKMTNLNKVSNNEDYAALYLVKGNAVFSVDLKNISIELSDDFSTAKVTVPDVTADIYIDDTATEKLAEYQKSKFTGSAEDGFTEYINTSNQLAEKAEESISNYDQLKESARSSAKKQITDMVKNFNSRKVDVEIKFSGEAV